MILLGALACVGITYAGIRLGLNVDSVERGAGITLLVVGLCGSALLGVLSALERTL